MNYSAYYDEYVSFEDKVKVLSAQVAKLYKAINKDMKAGDIKAALKDTEALSVVTAELSEAAKEIKREVNSFDSAVYFQSGNYAKDLLEECDNLGINHIGDFPVYEMFPYKVKVDYENQDVYINRKKYSTMNPAYFASVIKAGLDKLNSDKSFKADKFADELEPVYELCLLQLGAKAKGHVKLSDLYKALCPMARIRKDYDMNAFAFDIARLYPESLKSDFVTKKGSRVELGTSRGADKGIRILDEAGNEYNVFTIRFYKAEN